MTTDKEFDTQLVVRRILIECHHGIGDVVMTFPALRMLQRAFPKTMIHMLCGTKEQIPLINQLGIVKHYYSYDVKSDSYMKLLRIIWEMRRQNYDLGIALGQSSKGVDVCLLKLGGCKKIISMKNEKAWYKKYEAVDIRKYCHRSEQNIAYVERAMKLYGQIPQKANSINKELLFPDIQRAEGIVGICIGTGDFFYRKGYKKIFYNAKEWPVRRWMELSKRLTKIGLKIFLFGAKTESTKIHCFLKKNPQYKDVNIVDLCGRYNLLDTAKKMSICSLVIGCDTGLMHVAAAQQIPTITLFASTNPYSIGPYADNAEYICANLDCSPCHGKGQMIEKCAKRKCREAISVQQVYNHAIKVLSRQKR